MTLYYLLITVYHLTFNNNTSLNPIKKNHKINEKFSSYYSFWNIILNALRSNLIKCFIQIILVTYKLFTVKDSKRTRNCHKNQNRRRNTYSNQSPELTLGQHRVYLAFLIRLALMTEWLTDCPLWMSDIKFNDSLIDNTLHDLSWHDSHRVIEFRPVHLYVNLLY